MVPRTRRHGGEWRALEVVERKLERAGGVAALPAIERATWSEVQGGPPPTSTPAHADQSITNRITE